MRKPWLALIVLLSFATFTLWTLWRAEQSLLAFGMDLLSSSDTAQVVIDLYLLAAMACVWMYRDARARGRKIMTLVPYWLLTLVFVSIGPLLYVVVNGFRHTRQAKP